MFNVRKGFYFQNEGAAGGGGTSSSSGNGSSDDKGTGDALTYETWIEKQDEKVKGLLDGHTKGLKSALDTERESRKGLEKQVRDLAAKAEKGSEAEKQLTEFADKLADSDRRADFFDAAHRAGVSNLKLAYITAKEEELFDRKGNVDFAAMKKSFPELFGVKQAPNGNAGEGTENNNNVAVDMNTRIRRSAGRAS